MALHKQQTLVERARAFATAAHAAVGQRRKYTDEPYITHPEAVVAILKTVPHTPEMLAAAWLHDVVEDAGVEIGKIRDEFGDATATLIAWVTNVSKPSDGDRAARVAIDRAHLAHAPAEAQTVKLADVIDNTATIRERDPAFAAIYLHEKAELLKALTIGDPDLLKRAWDQIGSGDQR